MDNALPWSINLLCVSFAIFLFFAGPAMIYSIAFPPPDHGGCPEEVIHARP